MAVEAEDDVSVRAPRALFAAQENLPQQQGHKGDGDMRQVVPALENKGKIIPVWGAL